MLTTRPHGPVAFDHSVCQFSVSYGLTNRDAVSLSFQEELLSPITVGLVLICWW